MARDPARYVRYVAQVSQRRRRVVCPSGAVSLTLARIDQASAPVSGRTYAHLGGDRRQYSETRHRGSRRRTSCQSPFKLRPPRSARHRKTIGFVHRQLEPLRPVATDRVSLLTLPPGDSLATGGETIRAQIHHSSTCSRSCCRASQRKVYIKLRCWAGAIRAVYIPLAALEVGASSGARQSLAHCDNHLTFGLPPRPAGWPGVAGSRPRRRRVRRAAITAALNCSLLARVPFQDSNYGVNQAPAAHRPPVRREFTASISSSVGAPLFTPLRASPSGGYSSAVVSQADTLAAPRDVVLPQDLALATRPLGSRDY